LFKKNKANQRACEQKVNEKIFKSFENDCRAVFSICCARAFVETSSRLMGQEIGNPIKTQYDRLVCIPELFIGVDFMLKLTHLTLDGIFKDDILTK